MPKECLEVLLGTLLGDGSLKRNKNYINARFSMRHAERFYSYLKWKADNMKSLASDKAIHLQQVCKGSYGKTPMYRFQTLANGVLTELHSIVTVKNKLKIKRSWLNHLTPLSLMCWWLDDGSIMGNGRKGTICTDSFSRSEVEILSKYLQVVWKIKTTVSRRKIKDKVNKRERFVFRLSISTTPLKDFLRIFLQYIPTKEMIYKVCLLYNDYELQQRWISELKRNIPQFSSEIDKFYSEKQKKNQRSMNNYVTTKKMGAPIS
uniref:Homing endonuclease LAGLIDADG domain-containing protein n=1 Tax=Borodinellopsis insignis TaxID=3229915 RepID=A0AB39A664_9CHLO